ncbi:MAG: glycosyltransferase family 4 protein [Bacteriovoracia bacterium]
MNTTEIGFIYKPEPEMAGIFRWSTDFLEAMSLPVATQPSYEVIPFAVRATPFGFSERLLGLVGKYAKKDFLNAFKNYPRFIEAKNGRDPTVWHLASQTFCRLISHLDGLKIVTVHDLYPHLFQCYASRQDRVSFESQIGLLEKADYIFTVSESSRREVIAALNRDPNTVFAIRPATHIPVEPKVAIERSSNEILYVGSETPRKNLKMLFLALKKVFEKNAHAKLIKIGRPQWKGAREELIQLANQLGINNRIEFKDYVPDISEFYRRAAAVVLVSKHEGFGYSVAEAMQYGCPVIASNLPVLRETSFNCAEFVDPFDVDSIANSILKVLDNKKLRESLSNDGQNKIRGYGFEDWQKQMFLAYSKVLSSHRL